MAKLVVRKEEEIRAETPKTDEPQPKALRRQDNQEGDLFKSAQQLLETFGHARIGRTVFSDYAIEYGLKDECKPLYYLFMFVGYIVDMALAVFIVALISIMLIAFVYLVLRGADAWGQTVHIVRLLLEYVHMPLPH